MSLAALDVALELELSAPFRNESDPCRGAGLHVGADPQLGHAEAVVLVERGDLEHDRFALAQGDLARLEGELLRRHVDYALGLRRAARDEHQERSTDRGERKEPSETISGTRPHQPP